MFFAFFRASPDLGMRVKDMYGNILPDWKGYDDSKLLNVMHARELARRLEGNQCSPRQ